MIDLTVPTHYSFKDSPITENTYDLVMAWESLTTEQLHALIKVLVRHDDPDIKSKY